MIVHRGWRVIGAVVCAAGLILLQWVLPDVAAPAFILLIVSAILLAIWGRPRSHLHSDLDVNALTDGSEEYPELAEHLSSDDAQPAVLPSSPVKPIQEDFSSRRWFAFVLSMLALLVGFMALQDPDPFVSIILFVALLLGSVGLAFPRLTQAIRQFISSVVGVARLPYEAVNRAITKRLAAFHNFILPMSDRLSTTTAWLSVVAMGVAAVTVRFIAPASAALNIALLIVVMGTVLLGLSVSLKPNLTSMEQIERTGIVATNRSSWIVTGVGIFILLALAEINGKVLPITALVSVDINVQFLMLILGIALLVIGLNGKPVMSSLYAAFLNFSHPQSKSAVTSEITPDPSQAISGNLILTGAGNPKSFIVRLFSAVTEQHTILFLTFLALILRFWALNNSYRFFIDELLNISAVLDIGISHNLPLLAPFSSIAAFPYIFPYWQSAGVVIFGHTFLGVRAVSAVLGALAVPGLYLLAKTLFDHKTAFIAALLLATFPPHLQFSRIGINEMGAPLFATFAFLFLARGILYNRRLDYALGGALLGLTHYFDEGARLLFTPMIATWMIGLIIIWKPHRRLRNYGIALIALLLVAAPIYYTLTGMNRPVAARMIENSSGLNGDYWYELFHNDTMQQHIQQHIDTHIIPAFTVYFNRLDTTRFYMGETALLLVYAIPFFLLGLTYLLWNWRSPGALLFLLWIFCVSFGNTLLVFSDNYPRFVLGFAAVTLVVAVGIRYVVPLVLQPERLRRWQTPVMMTLGILLAFAQTNYYFNEHIPTFSQQFRDNWPHPDAEDGILRAQNFPLGTELHFVSPVPPDVNYNKGAASFLSDNRLYVDTHSPDELTTQYFLSLTCGVEHIFFLNSDDFDSLRRIQRYFVLEPPQWSPYDDIPPRKQFVMFVAQELPARTSIYSRHCS